MAMILESVVRSSVVLHILYMKRQQHRHENVKFCGNCV